MTEEQWGELWRELRDRVKFMNFAYEYADTTEEYMAVCREPVPKEPTG